MPTSLEREKSSEMFAVSSWGRFLKPQSSSESAKMSRKDWNEMADWYDAKQGDEGDLWHRTLIDPALLQVVGAVNGLRVLDLGCGNGYLARKLAKQGAKVTGVDNSVRLIELAKARDEQNSPGIIYHATDAAKLVMLEDETFDLVVSNMALMNIARSDLAIREAARVLRAQGRFVASLSHPCFDIGLSSGWSIERIGLTSVVWRKVRQYREQHEHLVPWNIAPGQVAETISYHRPLAWYFRTLRDAGFAVTRFEEPDPTPEFKVNSLQGEWIAQVPVHCVIEAIKQQIRL